MSDESKSKEDEDYLGLNDYSDVPKLVEYDENSEDEDENLETREEVWSTRGKI